MSFNGEKTITEAARDTREAVKEMFEAIPKRKRIEYLGHYNEILVNLDEFIRRADIQNVVPKP